ncbi:putative dehydrogenase [Neolewinella xylanilytica]|uniref:Putative dehydrogenase n=1 Tax=Neolewinella xylanilytica TaxID=1514080 RepID=A0A2S6IBK7_9BACT|nr:Gfo/Idh/MocA family oxidoreductase [Neolewinella xylanilytica]PPK88878.1 putative dehydrogenase [Neolewinella xylanilytica]
MVPQRFVVIGFGHIGRRHAALIAAHPEAELVAVCDALPPELLRRPPGAQLSVPFYQDLDVLLREVVFDVACICTPNGLHAPQALRCLTSGHHVVVEKPIALTVSECDQLIAAAMTHQREIFGVMQNRYSPASAWLKQLVADGQFGEILQVHIDCFWNRDARYYRTEEGQPHPWHGDAVLDGGVLFTQFAHFIDLLCWTFGRVEVLSARATNQTHTSLHPFPDSGMVHFRLEAGGFGSLNYSTVVWDKNFESTLSVLGTHGTVKLGGQYMNELRYCHVQGVCEPTLAPSAPPNNYGPYQGSAANHHFVIDNVVNVLNGREAVATTAEEGREVVELIAAIQAGSEPG